MQSASSLNDLKTTGKQQFHHKLVIGNRNSGSLTRKEHEVVEEAKRYFLDVASNLFD